MAQPFLAREEVEKVLKSESGFRYGFWGAVVVRAIGRLDALVVLANITLSRGPYVLFLLTKDEDLKVTSRKLATFEGYEPVVGEVRLKNDGEQDFFEVKMEKPLGSFRVKVSG